MEFDIRPWLVRLMPAVPVVVALWAGPVKAGDLRPDVRVTEDTRRCSPHYLLPSPPGWFGPGPGWGSWRGYGPGVGWTYYNTPGGPTTAFTGWWGYNQEYSLLMGNGFVSGPGGAPFGLGAGGYNYGGYGYRYYNRPYGIGLGFPGATGSFWTNGNSLYGPPIPTYAPVPGAFGGSQAHKTHFMQNVYGSGLVTHNWFGYQKPTPPPDWQRVSVYPQTVEGPAEYRVMPVNGKCARFQMTMPSADAELWIGSTATKYRGLSRDYESPELDAAKDYSYEFIARWTENGEPKAALRTVKFKAGEAHNIDFTKDAE